MNKYRVKDFGGGWVQCHGLPELAHELFGCPERAVQRYGFGAWGTFAPYQYKEALDIYQKGYDRAVQEAAEDAAGEDL